METNERSGIIEHAEKTGLGFFNSLGFKLAFIGFLTLLLLIPSNMILDLIREREQRRIETENEVTSIWGNAQTIAGPVLSIPYTSGNKVTIHHAHILPENLKIEGRVEPEVRNRGIYKVVTYKSVLHISGNFNKVDLQSLGLPQTILETSNPCLEIGIPDLRGINRNIQVKWNNLSLSVVPGLKSTDLTASGVHTPVKLSADTAYHFSFDLDLNGSHTLSFVPLGKETNVIINSSWTAPSFNGAFIPDDKKINEKGFYARWNVLQLNRNYPQQWINDQYSIDESAFGVDLITPVDTYRKSERSVKYAILFIGLTFLTFFFAEVMTKTRIHAVNYLLTGFALCIFYSLLTALSEHINFNLAYLISGITIVSMIAVFAQSLYKNRRVTMVIITILSVLYIFLFVILQLMDYSLLFGNIGLVLILALIMYFSRKIDWYSPVKSVKQ
jgi:inner membrane protein